MPMKVPSALESPIALEQSLMSCQLGNREQADQYRDELDAVAERMDTEGVALHAGGEVLADGGEQYAEGAGDQVLGGAVAAGHRHPRPAEHREREVIRRAER